MGFVADLRTGLSVMKRSVELLRRHPKLLVFPLLSALSLLVFFVGGVIGIAVLAVVTGVGEGVLGGVWWLGAVAVGYFVAAVLSTYFNSGLVHETTRVIQGEAPSVRRGLAAGWRVKEKILVWGLISSVFGVVIEILETSDSRFAWFVSALLQASWAVLTFFVVPVILFTDVGVGGMFEESARTFRDVWGESLTASLGIDLLSALGVVIVVVGMIVLAAVLPPVVAGVLVAAGVAFLVFLLVVRAAAHGVAKATLYQYASTGSLPDVLGDLDVPAIGRGEM